MRSPFFPSLAFALSFFVVNAFRSGVGSNLCHLIRFKTLVSDLFYRCLFLLSFLLLTLFLSFSLFPPSFFLFSRYNNALMNGFLKCLFTKLFTFVAWLLSSALAFHGVLYLPIFSSHSLLLLSSYFTTFSQLVLVFLIFFLFHLSLDSLRWSSLLFSLLLRSLRTNMGSFNDLCFTDMKQLVQEFCDDEDSQVSFLYFWYIFLWFY